MKEYKCPNCGATINRATMTCEYCGTKFREENSNSVVVLRPGVHVLGCSRILRNEMAYVIGEEKASEYVLHEIAREMAECIIPFLDIKAVNEPITNSTKIVTRLRVVEPTYTF